MVEDFVILRNGDEVMVFNFNLKPQECAEFTLRTIHNNNNYKIKIKNKQI